MHTPTAQRLPYLDGLRVMAFALLIPYHVGMYYVTWDWHVKSPAASQTLEPFMLLSSPWRLGLLFLIGGAASQRLLARRGGWGTLRERSLRLLLPLLFGMAVIVPPQAYFELLTQAPKLLPGDGGYADFWWAYLHGGRYCRGTDCMTVPTWNHLWFLPYLWLYALVGVALTAAFDRLRGTRSGPVFNPPSWVWLLLPAVPLVLARVFVFPHHPSTHNLHHDLYNHLQYGWLFALGWISCTPLADGLQPATARHRTMTLVAALTSWAALIVYFTTYADRAPPPALLTAQRVLWALMSWWAIVAACGWAQKVFTRPNASLKTANGALLCMYVLHQTVIVVLTQALKPLALPWAFEAVLLTALTVALCALGYHVLKGVPVLAACVGIQRKPKKQGP